MSIIPILRERNYGLERICTTEQVSGRARTQTQLYLTPKLIFFNYNTIPRVSPNYAAYFSEFWGFFVSLLRGIELASLLPPHSSNHFIYISSKDVSLSFGLEEAKLGDAD